ncbi:MAG: threonine synthase [Bryobacteraceae bacterium]|jgi:threonine synthase
MTTLTELECSRCGARYDPAQARNVCTCGGPLLARYDLATVRASWSRDWIRSGPTSMWRCAPVLPVRNPASIVSLGEGLTPLVRTARLAERMGARELWIKDESLNPTGSFHARGLSCAVSMARELGIQEVGMASTGPAAHALAAYAAASGIPAHLFLPRDVPRADLVGCQACGAEVTLVDGLLDAAAQALAAAQQTRGWFDLSALQEPYRLEGQKTMAYELAEEMGWRLPDAMLCPVGSGLGLISAWKAFEEMEQLGWIGPERPRMITVQAQGCRPVVDAFERGADHCDVFERAHTVAAGLRVPKPAGDSLILAILRQSGGTAVAVADHEMLGAAAELAELEGILPAPEGGACVAALRGLLESGFLQPESRVVIVNPASGLRYVETYATRLPRAACSEQDKLGGLITPR